MKVIKKNKKSCYILGTILLLLMIVHKNIYAYSNYYDTIPDISTLNESDLKLPNKYDLRNVNDINYTTPVKNQGSYGLCWAFSSTTAFETALKKSGYVSSDFNEWYSPYQVDALVTRGVKTPNINYINDTPNKYRRLGDGAGGPLALKAFTTAYSPVLESTFNETKYSEHYNSKYKFNAYDIFNEKNAEYYVTDYDVLKSINGISIQNVVKYYIYNYGAVVVGTASPTSFCDNYYSDCYMDVSDGYSSSGHAMAIIGWDDSKDSWILQNSWGNLLKYIYLSYKSADTDYYGIKKISKKDWDNRYYGDNLSKEHDTSIYEFNKIPNNDEVIDSILVDIEYPGEYSLFLSSNGNTNNYELITNFNAPMSGRKTINLSNQNIELKDAKFGIKVIYNNYSNEYYVNANEDTYVFTKDKNNSPVKKMYIYDIYDITSRNQTLMIKFKSFNIKDKSEIKFRIKNHLGNDVTEDFKLKDSYLSDNYGQFEFEIKTSQLPSEYVEYTVEALVNNNVIDSKKMGVSNMDDIFKAGTGTEDDPFIITSFSQLNSLDTNNNYLKYSYKLGCDIDASGKTFTPIGNLENPFTGTFDGNNYSIINLDKFEDDTSYYGLFSYINGATIKNLKFKNSGITTKKRISVGGLIAAKAINSSISNIQVEGGMINVNMDTSQGFGSIAGVIKNTSLSNISSSSNITVNADCTAIGGLIGMVNSKENTDKSYIKESEFLGQININSSIVITPSLGEIVGRINDDYFEMNNLLVRGTINIDCSNNQQKCSEIKNSTGYIAGRFINSTNDSYKNITNSIYYMGDEEISIISTFRDYPPNKYENVYAIIDYDKEESDRYINKNSEKYLNESTYNLDFNNIWHINYDRPILISLSKIIDKSDLIGESKLYNIDLNNQAISNVKTNEGSLTKKEFIDGFIAFSGELYTKEGIKITTDNELIKTGMIVKKNNKEYEIAVLGDIDGDGAVNTKDTILIRRYLVDMIQLNKIQLLAADINQDGRVNVADVIYIRRGIVGGYQNACIWRDCE